MAEHRIKSLDVIRGFALAGIYLTNILYFSGTHFSPTSGYATAFLSRFDTFTTFFISTFVDQIFFAVFCILFGIGFYLFCTPSKAPFARESVFARRLSVLFVIGMVHALFLWYGDILSSYALMGFGLFALNRLSTQKLARVILILLSISCVVIPLIFCLLDYASLLPAPPVHPEAEEGMPGIRPQDFFTTLAHGSYQDIFILNLRMFCWKIIYHLFSGKLVNIAVFFATGLYIAKTCLQHARRNSFLFTTKKSLLLCGLLGLGATLTHTLLRLTILGKINLNGFAILDNLLSTGGALLLALTCMELISRITERLPLFSGWIAQYGRLALTNYLLQTVFSLLIFYGFGLSFYGITSKTACMLIAFGVICLQIMLSCLWLKFYAQGPLEWGWRRLTEPRKYPSLITRGV